MKTEKRRFHCLGQSLAGWIGTAALLAWGSLAVPGALAAGGSGPAMTALEPDEGPVGTEVVIRGENFGSAIGVLQGTSGVSFGGVWASPSAWSEGEVRVEVPAGATTGAVVVTVSGVGSEGLAFTVTGAGTGGPAVGTVSPAQGAAGTEVVIRGTGFGPAEGAEQGTAGVSFNGVAGTPASWSGTEIRVAVPEGVTAGPVVVTVGGEASNGVRFTVTAADAPRPSIVSVSPERATAGTEVVIRGENFGDPEGAAQGTRGVSFNGVWAEPSLWSEGEIRAAVPEGAPGGQVVVTVEGRASNGVAFTVAGPAPVIATVDPTHGPEETGVVIRGENFGAPIGAAQGTAGVSFGGVWAEPTLWSGTEIRAAAPEGVESGLVTVTVGGQESNGVDFTVTAGGKAMAGSTVATVSASTSDEEEENSGPEITSLSPEEGAVGTSVTVTGTGFGAVAGDTSTVSFNGVAGVPTFWSETAIRVPVPAGATSGPVTVTVGGQKSNGVEFRLTPPLAISVVSGIEESDRTATVTVSVPAGEQPATDTLVTITFGGTAERGTDYTMAATATLPAGKRLVKTLLTVIDDTDYEFRETITLQATAEGFQASPLKETYVFDNDSTKLTVTADPTSVGEAASDRTATVTVSVPEGSEPATDAGIVFSRTGKARHGIDYTMEFAVTLPAEEASVTTTLEVTDDAVYEGEETIVLHATGNLGTGLDRSDPVTIQLADDELPPLTLTVTPASVGEADGERTATVKVTVPGAAALAADLTVDLLHTGTARVTTGDYTVGVLTIEANQNRPTTSAPFTGTATLEVVDDSDYEGAETIGLQATHADYQSSAVVEIPLADDDLPLLTLTADATSVAEPDGTATLTVTVPEAAAPAAEAAITLEHTGSATSGTDYRVGTLTIAAGDLSGTATLRVRDNTVFEGAKTISLQATHSDYQASALVEIALVDDELPPLTLTADAASVSEPDGTLTLTVSVPEGGAPDADTTIGIWDLGYARKGEDFSVETLTIEKGDLSGTATLEVIDDAVYEGTEEIWLQAAKEGYKISPVLKIPLEDNERNQAPVVSSPLPALTTNVDVASTVSLSSHFSDPEGHDLSYEATSSEPSVVTVSVSGGTLTVTGVGVGVSTITVTATDQPQDSDDSLPTGTTFTATVENRAPECEDIDDQTVNVNVWQSLTASCTDPDGHELTYSHVSSDTSKVDTTTTSPKQSGFSVIGVDVGTATVTVTATDGHQGSAMVKFDVTVPNRAPVCDIPAQTLLVAESQTVDLSQYCSDPDGHPLTYGVASSATDEVTASVDGSTLTLTGVAVGSSTIIVTATDPHGDFDDEAFTATVENRAPVCEDVDDQTVTAGKSKTLTVSCTDPDGHELSYVPTSSNTSKVTVSNDGASVTLTGVVAGIPTVTVTATDGHEGSAMVTFTVTVPNQAPLCSDIPAQTFVVANSQTVDLSQYCSDPDGHPLSYGVASSATDKVTASVDGSTLTLTGVAVTAETLPTITVTATDQPDEPQESLSDTETFTATIENHDPDCDDIAGQTVKVGQSKTLTVSCTDPDGHNLSYTTSSSDTSKVTVSKDGASVTVNAAAVGSATMTVTASDGYGGSDTKTFDVTVPTPPCTISSIDGQTVKVTKSKTVSLSATCDPPADTLTYTATSSDTAKATASVSGSTLTVTGVAEGTATVTVTVTDGRGGSDTETLGVTVEPLNEPPVCSNIPIPTLWVNDSTTVDLSQYCSDPDGDNINYSASSSSTSKVTVSVTNYPNSNRGTLTLTGKAIGSSTITVTASDGSLSTTKTPTATVKNRDPDCEDIDDQTVYVNASKTLTVSCSDADGHSLSYSASSSDTSKVTASRDGASVTVTGVAAGTATVSVTATDGYGGSDTVTFTVTAIPRPEPPEAELTADKTTLYPDECTDLNWETTYTTTASINQGIGTVTPTAEGSIEVCPGSTKTYTLTATGRPGAKPKTDSDSVKLTVIPRPEPPEAELTADKTTLYPDECTDLNWETTYTTTASINQGIGTVTPTAEGSIEVCPGSTKTYTLTATGRPGAKPKTDSDSVKLTVIPRPEPPEAELTADKTTLYPDECTDLNWETTYTTTASINQGIGTVTPTAEGSIEVCPGSTKTYTLTATGRPGAKPKTDGDSVKLTVIPRPEPPEAELTADKTTLYPDECTDLNWETTYTTTASINQGIGTVTPTAEGSIEVCPGSTKTYTLTATGRPGAKPRTDSDSVKLTVIPRPEPPEAELTADKTTLYPDECTDLNWETTYTTTASINQGIGTVTPTAEGSIEVCPGSTKTYTLTATGRPGAKPKTDSDSVKLTVIPRPEPPEAELTADKTTLYPDECTDLNWETTYTTTASINQGIGTVTPTAEGSIEVCPGSTKTYTLTATGRPGAKPKTDSDSVKLTVIPRPEPPEAELTADKTTLYPDECTDLNWETTYTTTASINQGIGTVTPTAEGSIEVCPGSTKTYTLTATGRPGAKPKTDGDSVKLTVIPRPEPPEAELTADKTTLYPDECTDLNWETTYTTTASINQGIGTVTPTAEGSIEVCPGSTKTYTLTATGRPGAKPKTDSDSVKLTVIPRPEPPEAELTADKTTLYPDECTDLNWETTYTTTASINQGIGTVTPTAEGSIEVCPGSTKTYTLTATGRPGAKPKTDSDSVKLTVIPRPEPPEAELTADKTTLYPDECTDLNWETTYTTTASINQGIGTVTPTAEGSIEVCPGSTKTYTLTATGRPGAKPKTDGDSVKLTVIPRPEPPEAELTADKTTLYPDECTDLNWETTYTTTASINQGIGTVTPTAEGSIEVCPGSTKTYTLTATGRPGAKPRTDSDSVKLTVVDRLCSLSSISNQTVNVGASKTLSLPDTDDCTYSATSSDTSKVTVSVNNSTDTVTVTGVAVGTATVSVSVTSVSGSDTFTVTVVMPSPAISRISPNLGQTDTRATIYGANFGTDEGSVSFGGSSADINSWNDTWISVLVPLHLSVGTVSVSVTTAHSAGSKTSNSVTFRVTGGPVQRDEEEECEDEKDCPEGEGGDEEKGEEEGGEGDGETGETEEDPSGG